MKLLSAFLVLATTWQAATATTMTGAAPLPNPVQAQGRFGSVEECVWLWMNTFEYLNRETSLIFIHAQPPKPRLSRNPTISLLPGVVWRVASWPSDCRRPIPTNAFWSSKRVGPITIISLFACRRVFCVSFGPCMIGSTNRVAKRPVTDATFSCNAAR